MPNEETFEHHIEGTAVDIELVWSGCGHTIHIDTLNEETSDDHIANNRLGHLQGSSHQIYRQEG